MSRNRSSLLIPHAFLPLMTLGAGLSGPAIAQETLPPITIIATPIVQTAPTPGDLLNQSFHAVTTMTADQLQGGAALGTGGSLGNALFDRPGLSASTYAPGASRPIIRGLDNFRVRVQENGTSTM